MAARTPDHFWYAIKKGEVKIFDRHVLTHEMLGIKIDLGLPARNISWGSPNLLKPLLDGVVSAFHSQKADSPSDGRDRITKIVDRLKLIHNAVRETLAPDVEYHLYDQTNAVLGSIDLVTFLNNRKSIQWKPLDENIVHAEIAISSGSQFSHLSGELFRVEPSG